MFNQFSISVKISQRKNNNIESVTQGCGWDSSINSYADFIHKMESTWRLFRASMWLENFISQNLPHVILNSPNWLPFPENT